jgi:hypothetical protein
MHAHGHDQLQFASVQSRTLASPNQYNASQRLRGGKRIRCVCYGNGAGKQPTTSRRHTSGILTASYGEELNSPKG